MTSSGKLSQTLNVLPVLSGIYKSTGHKISLVVRNDMMVFNGLKEFMHMQDCIAAFKFEYEAAIDDSYQTISRFDNFKADPNVPFETLRLEQDFKARYNIDFEIDNSFVLNVPDVEPIQDKYLVGDKSSTNFLASTGKFPLDKCHFLDYNNTVAFNAGLIKASPNPLLSTITGISVIGDLLNKEVLVLWDKSLIKEGDKHITYYYNKQYYRDRNCVFLPMEEFQIPEEDTL
jgi:hypothetical protein